MGFNSGFKGLIF